MNCWEYCSILLLLSACFPSAQGYAQNTDPATTLNAPQPDIAPGPPQTGTVEQNAHEQLSLGTGSLDLFIPVVSLPQLGGRTLTLGYVHSSNTWAAKETSATYNQYGTANASNPQTWWLETYATVQYLPTATPWNDALHLNVPTLVGDLSYAGAWLPYGSLNYQSTYCMSGWTFTDWHGSSHSFRGFRDCTTSGDRYTSNYWMAQVEATDDSGYQIDTTNTADLKIVGPDGMVYHFSGYNPPPNTTNGYMQLGYYARTFSSMVDPNGNTVSVSGTTLTDTTGRQVSLDGNLSWTYQSTLSSAPATASVVRSESNSGVTTAFPASGVDTCQAKPSAYGQAASAAGYPGDQIQFQNPPTTYTSSSTKLTLPDSSYYLLTYDSLNRLTTIRYPSGGYTRYDYAVTGSITKDEGDLLCNQPTTVIVAKHECTLANGGCSPSPQATASSCQAGVASGGEATTCYTEGSSGLAVTDPVMNQTLYTFTVPYLSPSNGMFGDIPRYFPPLETNRQTFATGSTALLRTVATSYSSLSGCPAQGENCLNVPSSWTTTYNDGSPVQSVTTTQQTQYPNLPVSSQQNDFSGSPVSTATSSYNSGGIYAIMPPTAGALYHILDHVQTETSTDSVQHLSKTATNTYDARGNLTQIDVSGTNVPTATTRYARDASGNITLFQDPDETSGVHSGSTSISYVDQSVPGCPHSSNVGLPTLITNALNQSTAHAYYPSGTLACTKDANSNITTYSYDSHGRLTQVHSPDGGQLTKVYTSSDPLQVTSTRTMNASQSMVQTASVDGFGRSAQTILASAPGSQVCTETYYDAAGNVRAIDDPNTSCPSSSGSPLSGASISYLYDGLGRKTRQTNEDGSTQQWSYSGPIVSFTDEASHQWQRTSDALGRLVKVLEPNAGAGTPETDYGYDGFGNLWSVAQKGAGQDLQRNRSFAYDGFSRLLWSSNPETGVICYGVGNGSASGCQLGGYDGNGNLLHKTDSRAVRTDYTYDGLNRLVNKSYSDGTYQARLGYDGNDASGPPLSQYGIQSLNSIGRLSHESNWVNADQTFSYDAVGHISAQTYCLPDNCGTRQSASALYDFAGDMTELTYPSGRHIKQTWDSAGRLNTSDLVDIGGVSQTQSYLQPGSYFPDGSPSTITLGNGVQQIIQENNRLQIQGLVASTPLPPLNGQQFLSHTYCYVNCPNGGQTGDNGNIGQIADTLNGTRTQSFTYDAVNRISSFTLGGTVMEQYNIDSFGNMKNTLVQSPLGFGSDNRVNNFTCASPATAAYDAAGNQVCDTDPTTHGVRQYSFDAEDRIAGISVPGNQPFETYTYGADGARVRKSNKDGTYTEYVDFGGQPIAEKDQTGTWTDYIYAVGKKIAVIPGQDHRIHTYGTATGNWTLLRWNLPTPQNSAGGGAYTVKAGDRMCFRQFSNSGVGGPIIWFTNGSSTAWSWTATDGQLLNQMSSPQHQWVSRCVDLTGGGSTTGSQISTLAIFTDSETPAGPWDIYYADMSISSKDGTVTPIIGVQPPTPVYGDFNGDFNGTPTATVESVSTSGIDSRPATHFYVADHLGSAQLEFAAGGWPITSSQFTPFGGEINSQPTTNHYKFTGKERDAESGLDYFGARYYGSSMGRFMSPDWSAKAEPVPYAKLGNPQSLNLYSYVGNNPLSRRDPDGHYTCADSAKCNSANDKAFQGRLDNLKTAQGTFKEGSSQYNQIGKILSTYGGAGDTKTADGKTVSVGFSGGANAGGVTQAIGKGTIGVTLANNFSEQSSGNGNLSSTVLVGHEGQHVVDGAPSGTARFGSEMRAESVSQTILNGLVGTPVMPSDLEYFSIRGITTFQRDAPYAYNPGAAFRIAVDNYKQDVQNDPK